MNRVNFSDSLNEAKVALPLRQLMTQFGKDPTGKKCPFCNNDSAGLFKGKQGGELWKCHHSDCPSGTQMEGQSWDEVRFLMWELKKPNSESGWKEAAIELMKMAGVWEEYSPSPSILNPTRRKNPLPVDAEKLPPPAPVIAPVPEEASPHDAEPDPISPAAEPPVSNIVPLRPPTDPPKGPPSPPPAEPPKPKTVIERFYEQLVLTPEDREELRTKRGLTDATIDRLGFRSNHKANLEILQALRNEFDLDELIRSGLWKRGDKRSRQRESRPTGQFYGWGVVGKKRTAPDPDAPEDYEEVDTNEFEWAQKESGKCNPMLIPYFDADGKLLSVRPHKGFPKGQKPRLYVAQIVPGGPLVITEGEFKAAALADVLPKWSVVSLPGITQCKNFHVWADLLELIKFAEVRRAVVAFDNEEKGDPALPGYKEAFEKRFEAHVWARVLAARLVAEDVQVTISVLPDAWRENGKADWDSALARIRKSGEDPLRAFEEVLGTSIRAWEFRQMKFFEDDQEWVIADRAALFSYEPGLPCGGKQEKRWVEEARKLARDLYSAAGRDGEPINVSHKLTLLADAYDKTWGWYYRLKVPEMTREKLTGQKRNAVGAAQINAFNLLLKGTPELIAPFRMTPYYTLITPNGSRQRLVRLINIRHEDSGLVALPSKDLTAPRDWRHWLSEKGNYGWEGGERELQTLQRDMNFKLARRDVRQVVCYGCESPDSLWFFDDCAISNEVEVRPDNEGIIRHKRIGYTFLRNADGFPIGDEGQAFRLTEFPKMHPGQGIQNAGNGKFTLADGPDDPEALLSLVGELAINLQQSFASLDGLLLLANFISFCAAPEIYKQRGEFPGIWIVGEKGSGKTVAAKVCMALWGYARLDQTMSFKASTTVNAIITLSQLANIPNWGDEYKEGQIKEETIKNIIHCGFNREIPGKWSPDGFTRKIRTNFIVTGESTCANAATMDRFITVVAAKENWQGEQEQKHERFEWLLANRPHFFAIVRAILRKRTEFVDVVMREMAEWEKLPELSTAEPRGKFAHGVAYAALRGLLKVIPFMPGAEVAKFKDWIMQRTLAASREVQQMVNVNQFLADLVSGVKGGAFGDSTADLRKVFKVLPDRKAPSPVSAEQQREENLRFCWKSYRFYFQPGPVLDMMRIWMRKMGRNLALDQMDLRRQMQSRAFWMNPPTYTSRNPMHKQRFAGSSPEACWGLDVDKIPELGFCPVSEDEFEDSKYVDGVREHGNALSSDEWVDPRKGDLFYLIDMLLKKPKEQGE